MQALPSLWTSITRGRNDVMSVQGTEGHEIVENWILDWSTARNFKVYIYIQVLESRIS